MPFRQHHWRQNDKKMKLSFCRLSVVMSTLSYFHYFAISPAITKIRHGIIQPPYKWVLVAI